MPDLNGRLFERRGNHFVPSDLAAQELLQALPEGKKIVLDVKRPRHPENHAHFFAILREALKHLEGFPDEETLLDSIKMSAGHVRQLMLVDGTIVFVPKSIRFAAMDEDAFKRFKDRALFVLTELLGFDAALLLPEVRRDFKRNRR